MGFDNILKGHGKAKRGMHLPVNSSCANYISGPMNFKPSVMFWRPDSGFLNAWGIVSLESDAENNGTT